MGGGETHLWPDDTIGRLVLVLLDVVDRRAPESTRDDLAHLVLVVGRMAGEVEDRGGGGRRRELVGDLEEKSRHVGDVRREP